MKQTKYLVITVDTNDGDYEQIKIEETEDTKDKLHRIVKAIQVLPVEENYHYNRQGQKVVTGNLVSFDSRVGDTILGDPCGIDSWTIDEEEWEEDLWTTEEAHQENLLTPEEGKLLKDNLVIYNDYGFHSIISVQWELHTEPKVLLVVNL